MRQCLSTLQTKLWEGWLCCESSWHHLGPYLFFLHVANKNINEKTQQTLVFFCLQLLKISSTCKTTLPTTHNIDWHTHLYTHHSIQPSVRQLEMTLPSTCRPKNQLSTLSLLKTRYYYLRLTQQWDDSWLEKFVSTPSALLPVHPLLVPVLSPHPYLSALTCCNNACVSSPNHHLQPFKMLGTHTLSLFSMEPEYRTLQLGNRMEPWPLGKLGAWSPHQNWRTRDIAKITVRYSFLSMCHI